MTTNTPIAERISNLADTYAAALKKQVDVRIV
jgi:hypothetical protein